MELEQNLWMFHIYNKNQQHKLYTSFIYPNVRTQIMIVHTLSSQHHYNKQSKYWQQNNKLLGPQYNHQQSQIVELLSNNKTKITSNKATKKPLIRQQNPLVLETTHFIAFVFNILKESPTISPSYLTLMCYPHTCQVATVHWTKPE